MNRTEILDEATRIISKDRNATHGEPEDNFRTIATYWQQYLFSIGVFKSAQDSGGTRNLEPADIAAMMILMKVSRLATSPQHPDHWIDIAGYAGCGGGVATKEEPGPNPSAKHTFMPSHNEDNPYCELCGAPALHILHI